MKKAIILCALLVLTSCSNDDDNASGIEATAIDLVTGIDVVQDNNSEGYRLGNPNIRMPKNISSIRVYAYPKPATNNLTLGLFQTADVITDVWFVKANAQIIFQEIDFDSLLNEDTFNVNQVSQSAMHTISDLNSANITINLQGYETGYYKVFIKTSESLYWDNVYVDNDDLDITELFESWGQEF